MPVSRPSNPYHEEKKAEAAPAPAAPTAQAVDADDEELQRVMNWTGVQKRSAQVERKAATSNFLITINPNVSYKNLTPETRMALAKRLRDVSVAFMQHLKAGRFIKGKGEKLTQKPNAVNAQTRLEIGGTSGFLHTHNIVSFDGVCHIDLVEARKWLNKELASVTGGKSVHFNVASFTDTQKIMAAYISKQDKSASSAEYKI